MSREALALWVEAARDLSEVRVDLAAPVHVLMAEAVDLARFCRDYWLPVNESPSARPGLRDANPQVPEHIADDLLALQEALHAAHTEYLLTIPPIHSGMRARAESVLSELAAAVEWVLDDGQHDEKDEELGRIRDEHAPLSNSVNTLGVRLADYASLASKLRHKLASVSGFNMSLIDDAHHLARELRDVCTEVSLSQATALALDLRNRMATLLVNHMSLVRSAAAAVFHEHAPIAQLALSMFELRRRSEARRQSGYGESSLERAVPLALS